MKRVFITGRGLVTPLGIGVSENEIALREGRSGISYIQEWADYDLVSQIAGKVPEFPVHPILDRKLLRFCPSTAIMSVTAVAEALAEAGIPIAEIPEHRMAVIGGVAGSYLPEVRGAVETYQKEHKLRSVSPFGVPRIMPSSVVSNLSLIFGIKGESYDISAACSSSTICIMVATRLIRSGLYDVVIAGGAEELDWSQALGFTAMRALSSNYNATPEKACRPFDRDRDGFVMSSGAGFVILEAEDSIKRRNARPIAEVAGVASNSNATDMVVPDADAGEAVMRAAIEDAGIVPQDIRYLNTHGTATPIGDPVEIAAIKNLNASKIAVNSTKSMTGHMVGAAGAVEVIFSSIMQEKQFLCESVNLDNIDPACEGVDFIRELRTGVNLEHVLSNSFAFGGSNACVVLRDCLN